MVMAETAKVTSKSMVNIPAKIRQKYGLKQGTKVVFVESEGGITLIPVPSISDLFGADRDQREILVKGIQELEKEHRREARE